MNVPRTIIVEIPLLPPRELGPNRSRAMHWGQVARVKRLWQSAVYYAAFNHSGASFRRASVNISVVVKDRRSIMDTDNIIAIMKSAIDMLTARDRHGQVGLGLIIDDGPEYLNIATPIEWIVDKGRAPLTVLKFTEILLHEA